MGFSSKFSWGSLSLAGAVVILLGTRWGIGLSPDSIVYIAGARNLAEGRGFSMSNAISATAPITQFPPLYSVLLSIPGLFHLDPLDGARWVNAILFGANIFLICALINKTLNTKSQSTRLWLSIIGGWFLLTSPTMLEIHIMAWSEGLFLLLSLLGFYLLAMYLEEAKIGYLTGAAILIALAMLTRYAGMALWLTGVLVMALFLRRPWRTRIVSVFLFSVMSIIPFGVWLIRNLLVLGTATNRELIFHPIGKLNVSQAVTTLASWLLIQDTASTWVKLASLFAVGIIFLAAVRYKLDNREVIPLFVEILGIFLIVYFIFLAFSISFLDANTPLDGRILSPVYVSGLLMLIVLLGGTSLQFVRFGLVKGIGLGVIALLAVAYLIRDGSNVVNAYQSGLGINNIIWRQSETISFLKTLPKGIPIFSNAPEVIYIHSDRPASRIPSKYESSNQRVSPDYLSELAEVNTLLEAKHGVIVYFNTVKRVNLPEFDELAQKIDLYLIHQAGDGAIYGAH